MSKLINVSDEVYEKLHQMKMQQSYSEVIKKLLQKRGNKEQILQFFGKGGLNEKKVAEAQEYIRRWSKKSA